MVIEYQGEQNGIPTKFTIKIIGNNISKTSSNFQIDLLVGDKKLPTFRSFIHKSLSNCLKEVYLFRKHNGIKFDVSSEKIGAKFPIYTSNLYNYHKKTLFMA